jgi:ribonuclease P/MRP protein subunit POP1
VSATSLDESADGRYENGSRFAEVLLYHPDSFPLELIGPVEILWCPDGGKVWVRLHPSIFEETFDALKLATSTLSAGQMVHVRDLREDLGSFDFVGPLSGRLIRRVLRVCRNESSLKKRVSTRVSSSE